MILTANSSSPCNVENAVWTGAPELEAAWIASVGPPKAQVEAARRAAQRAAERGESGHWIRLGRTKEKRWVHDHDVPIEDIQPHDDEWTHRQTGEDVPAREHSSELMRAQKRNEDHMTELVDSWRAELQSLKRLGLRDRAMAEGISIAEFEETEGMFHLKNSHHRKAAVIDLIIKRLKANYLHREDAGVSGGHRGSSTQPRVSSRTTMRSNHFDNDGQAAETPTVRFNKNL